MSQSYERISTIHIKLKFLYKCRGASITKTLVEAGYDIIGTPMMPIPTRRNTQLYNSFSWTIPRTDDWFETRYEASIANSLLSSMANLLPDFLLSRLTTNITQSADYGLSNVDLGNIDTMFGKAIIGTEIYTPILPGQQCFVQAFGLNGTLHINWTVSPSFDDTKIKLFEKRFLDLLDEKKL